MSTGRCPVCGEAHAACGPMTTARPVDVPVNVELKGTGMKLVRVQIGPGHFLKMAPTQAEAYVKAHPGTSIAEAPATPPVADEVDEAAVKQRTRGSNKARDKAANKDSAPGETKDVITGLAAKGETQTDPPIPEDDQPPPTEDDGAGDGSAPPDDQDPAEE